MPFRRLFAIVVAGAVLGLAACVSSAPSPTGVVSPPGAASPPAASASPSSTPIVNPIATPAPSPSSGAAVCTKSGETGAVAVSIADFEFRPATIAATVGQVVTFSNTGFEPHNATVAAGCATRTLQTGESDGLVFSVPGAYPFACTVHAWMTGRFTIAP